MVLTVPQFNREFPEFKDLKDPFVSKFLVQAEKLLDEDSWGDFYDDAIGLVAAHNLALFNQTKQGGPKSGISGVHGQLVSASVAGMSASFNPFKVNDKSLHQQYYSKTSYGQAFLALQATVIPLAMLAI